ncbi:MAG: hypothetical protein CMH60_07850 [Myxococcales bacterium]|nr:hypothetical protein [Myxococcales bacterium]
MRACTFVFRACFEGRRASMSRYNSIVINELGELEILEDSKPHTSAESARKKIQKISSTKVLSTVLGKKKRTFMAEDANLSMKMFLDDDPSTVKKRVNLKELERPADKKKTP